MRHLTLARLRAVETSAGRINNGVRLPVVYEPKRALSELLLPAAFAACPASVFQASKDILRLGSGGGGRGLTSRIMVLQMVSECPISSARERAGSGGEVEGEDSDVAVNVSTQQVSVSLFLFLSLY